MVCIDVVGQPRTLLQQLEEQRARQSSGCAGVGPGEHCLDDWAGERAVTAGRFPRAVRVSGAHPHQQGCGGGERGSDTFAEVDSGVDRAWSQTTTLDDPAVAWIERAERFSDGAHDSRGESLALTHL